MLNKKIIGIVGSGQLGRMICIAAKKLGKKTHVFAHTKDDPACSVTDSVSIGDFSNKNLIISFAKSVDLVTVESENIPYDAINIISQYAEFFPSKRALYISQNRLREKDFIRNLNIRTVEYRKIQNYSELLENSKIFGYPVRLKTAEMGYDGKGQYIIKNDSHLKQLTSLDWSVNYILERDVDFLKEASIVVVRDKNRKTICYPVAENIHINGLLDTSIVPAKIADKITQRIKQTAEKIANELDIVGVFAIEFFITNNSELLVNELAPRPHNSCHWSLDACNISQFEQLVRAICGLPIQEIVLRFPCITKNIIGYNIYNSHKYLENKKASITIYGKKNIRDKRKMGHVNISLK